MEVWSLPVNIHCVVDDELRLSHDGGGGRALGLFLGFGAMELCPPSTHMHAREHTTCRMVGARTQNVHQPVSWLTLVGPQTYFPPRRCSCKPSLKICCFLIISRVYHCITTTVLFPNNREDKRHREDSSSPPQGPHANRTFLLPTVPTELAEIGNTFHTQLLIAVSFLSSGLPPQAPTPLTFLPLTVQLHLTSCLAHHEALGPWA